MLVQCPFISRQQARSSTVIRASGRAHVMAGATSDRSNANIGTSWRARAIRF
jgi:hypothetical protein